MHRCAPSDYNVTHCYSIQNLFLKRPAVVGIRRVADSDVYVVRKGTPRTKGVRTPAVVDRRTLEGW
jgi:hypothetical protein